MTQAVHEHALKDIIEPTINAMADESMPFVGFLYAGLMVDPQGKASVVEFNVRLGDPETQPLMMRMQSDLIDLLDNAVEGNLQEAKVQWQPGYAIGVVLAAGEYPAGSSKGALISGIEKAESQGAKIFHAGTRIEDGKLLTNGGRVLCATATGNTFQEAKTKADAAASCIDWEGVRFRSDIGHRALARDA